MIVRKQYSHSIHPTQFRRTVLVTRYRVLCFHCWGRAADRGKKRRTSGIFVIEIRAVIGIRRGIGRGFLFLGAATWGQRGINATVMGLIISPSVSSPVRCCSLVCRRS